ncbi:MAG TPA: DUF5107 domain-containing protein [Caldilineaceae bacterium]|nr:DUF5107 domain-containing protein [Caldilineaceae bacterium]
MRRIDSAGPRLIKRCALLVCLLIAGCRAPAIVRPTPAHGATYLPATAPGAALHEAAAVTISEETVTLPTYPFERYQTAAVDLRYRWPYQRFDIERFRAEAPAPTPRSYRVLVLENEYLKLLLLPDLGGRLWQVIHKPSGAPMFYQNSVVKPTHWGHTDQLGWMAVGGLEWGLPVIEHGYAWGVPWNYTVEGSGSAAAAVVLTTPADGRLLQARIRVGLRAGEARFTIEPQITNLSQTALLYSFWLDAMLAPGSGGQPSGQLHFVLPASRVQLHSTGDAALPQPGQPLEWPRYNGRDLSHLGNWRQYLGFFEAPAAQGPFAGVYDPAYDVGAVRVFPADVARGSKVFALGWHDGLTSDNYTDDTSAYVELHGGVAPSFFAEAQLPARGEVTWQESWYPVVGIGDLVFANEHGALNLVQTGGGLRLGFYPTEPFSGVVVVEESSQTVAQVPFQARPDAPFATLLAVPMPTAGPLTVRIIDRNGVVVLDSTE